MSEGLMASVDKLPPWAVPATAAVIVGLLLLKNNQSNAGYGVVRSYAPTASDPGINAITQSEIAAKSSAFQSAMSVIGATDISRISANRDISITQMQTEADIARTNAALASENYKTSVAGSLGFASLDAQLKTAINDAQTRARIAENSNATSLAQTKIAAQVTNKQTSTNFWSGLLKDLTQALPFIFA